MDKVDSESTAELVRGRVLHKYSTSNEKVAEPRLLGAGLRATPEGNFISVQHSEPRAWLALVPFNL